MTLHVDRVGSGPDLVMLHGWGLHGGLFAPVLNGLAQRHTVHVVDLPGHGRSRDPGPAGLDEWADRVSALVPEGATWLGWSLGGMVALHAALRDASSVSGLVLVSTTPRFTVADDWPHGQNPSALDSLATGLREDFRQTVDDFLTLQSLGDGDARARVRQLRAAVFQHGEPDSQALQAGLDMLRVADLRGPMAGLSTPALIIAGRRDRLTPPAAAQWMAATLPQAQLRVYRRAAHTPFLADPARFVTDVEEFIGVH